MCQVAPTWWTVFLKCWVHSSPLILLQDMYIVKFITQPNIVVFGRFWRKYSTYSSRSWSHSPSCGFYANFKWSPPTLISVTRPQILRDQVRLYANQFTPSWQDVVVKDILQYRPKDRSLQNPIVWPITSSLTTFVSSTCFPLKCFKTSVNYAT